MAVVAQVGDADDPHDAAAAPPIVQPQLFAVIDGQRQTVPFEDLTDEARCLQFKQRCQQAAAPVLLNPIEFFVWPDSGRFLFLNL